MPQKSSVLVEVQPRTVSIIEDDREEASRSFAEFGQSLIFVELKYGRGRAGRRFTPNDAVFPFSEAALRRIAGAIVEDDEDDSSEIATPKMLPTPPSTPPRSPLVWSSRSPSPSPIEATRANYQALLSPPMSPHPSEASQDDQDEEDFEVESLASEDLWQRDQVEGSPESESQASNVPEHDQIDEASPQDKSSTGNAPFLTTPNTTPTSRRITRASRSTQRRGWAAWEEDALKESVRHFMYHGNGRGMLAVDTWEAITARARRLHGLSRTSVANGGLADSSHFHLTGKKSRVNDKRICERITEEGDEKKKATQKMSSMSGADVEDGHKDDCCEGDEVAHCIR
ncbi:hypothetical protein IWZ00DRAFT_493113 [Phyllosticta capitalensis]